MKKLKTLICAALLVAGLSGCKKIDVNKLEGTWSEQYDPMVFAMDGYRQRNHHHQPGDVGLQQCHLQAREADIQ